MKWDELAILASIVVGIHWLTVVHGKTIAASERAQIVVEGVIFHHEYDDVINFGKTVSSDTSTQVGPIASVMNLLVSSTPSRARRFKLFEH